MTLDVVDRADPAPKRTGRLVVEVDGHVAELQYRVHNGKLILIHTEVPEALGGRGLGGMLVAAGLDKAAAEGLTVWPWCSYARSWLEKHPEEAKAVTIDWAEPPE